MPSTPIPPTEQALLAQFGKTHWRPSQQQLVHWALAAHSSLAVLPTGYGKSLCYQVAALLLPERCTIVVSPLIALMQDQIQFLQSCQVQASRYDSTLSPEEKETLLFQLKNNELQLLYLAPEALDNPELLHALSQTCLGLFVVDEAHCVSAWGHSFRPDYLRLPEFYKRFSFHALMALTATATPRVQEDLQRAFGIQKEYTLVLSPYRPNIQRDLHVSQDKLADLKSFLSAPQNRPAIVYVRSRKDAEEFAGLLSRENAPVLSYHAGQAPDVRMSTQSLFYENKVDVLVATIAFGMGIDKQDVRSVVHYHPPLSPESYVQESGRAGRDGAAANSLILIDGSDLVMCRNRIYAEQPDEEGVVRCARWLVPPYERVVSLWELETECDIPTELPERILAYLGDAVQTIAQGYKYYKMKALFPITTILCGRDKEESKRLSWLAEHPEGEVEDLCLAWDSPFEEAMEFLRDCELSQEWQLKFRQQAICIRRCKEVDAKEVAQALLHYYEQRCHNSLEKWEELLTMFSADTCLNQALDAYFMGAITLTSPCDHCAPCQGKRVTLPPEPLEQEAPSLQNIPEFARTGQRKRFLLGISSAASLRRRLWAHPLYGCLKGEKWERL